jgi:hypothetical protein
MSPKRGSTHVRFVFIRQTKFAGSELYSQKQLFGLTSTVESCGRLVGPGIGHRILVSQGRPRESL